MYLDVITRAGKFITVWVWINYNHSHQKLVIQTKFHLHVLTQLLHIIDWFFVILKVKCILFNNLVLSKYSVQEVQSAWGGGGGTHIHLCTYMYVCLCTGKIWQLAHIPFLRTNCLQHLQILKHHKYTLKDKNRICDGMHTTHNNHSLRALPVLGWEAMNAPWQPRSVYVTT